MVDVIQEHRFYHIKNLQSTKTQRKKCVRMPGFITLRIYKVLKPDTAIPCWQNGFITLRIYKVLKPTQDIDDKEVSFITLRIYKVLKPQQRLYALIHS